MAISRFDKPGAVDLSLDYYIPTEFVPNINMWDNALAKAQDSFDKQTAETQALKNLIPEAGYGTQKMREEFANEVDGKIKLLSDQLAKNGRIEGGNYTLMNIANEIKKDPRYAKIKEDNALKPTITQAMAKGDFDSAIQDFYNPSKSGQYGGFEQITDPNTAMGEFYRTVNPTDWQTAYRTSMDSNIRERITNTDSPSRFVTEMVKQADGTMAEKTYIVDSAGVKKEYTRELAKEILLDVGTDGRSLLDNMYESFTNDKNFRAAEFKQSTGANYTKDQYLNDLLNSSEGRYYTIEQTKDSIKSAGTVGKGSSKSSSDKRKEHSPFGMEVDVAKEGSGFSTPTEGAAAIKTGNDTIKAKEAFATGKLTEGLIANVDGAKVPGGYYDEAGKWKSFFKIEEDADGFTKLVPDAKAIYEHQKLDEGVGYTMDQMKEYARVYDHDFTKAANAIDLARNNVQWLEDIDRDFKETAGLIHPITGVDLADPTILDEVDKIRQSSLMSLIQATYKEAQDPIAGLGSDYGGLPIQVQSFIDDKMKQLTSGENLTDEDKAIVKEAEDRVYKYLETSGQAKEYKEYMRLYKEWGSQSIVPAGLFTFSAADAQDMREQTALTNIIMNVAAGGSIKNFAFEETNQELSQENVDAINKYFGEKTPDQLKHSVVGWRFDDDDGLVSVIRIPGVSISGKKGASSLIEVRNLSGLSNLISHPHMEKLEMYNRLQNTLKASHGRAGKVGNRTVEQLTRDSGAAKAGDYRITDKAGARQTFRTQADVIRYHVAERAINTMYLTGNVDNNIIEAIKSSIPQLTDDTINALKESHKLIPLKGELTNAKLKQSSEQIHPVFLREFKAVDDILSDGYTITDGYRSEEENATLPLAASNSPHKEGLGIDVRYSDGNKEALELKIFGDSSKKSMVNGIRYDIPGTNMTVLMHGEGNNLHFDFKLKQGFEI